MARLGLKPEANIFRISIKKGRAQNLTIAKPEVYRFPNTNTFVIFGDIQGDDAAGAGIAGADAARAAAAVTGGSAPAPEASTSTAEPVADDDEEVDQGDLGDKEIKLVMSQANVSRSKAIKALKNNKGDIVNTIMELTM